MADGVAREDVYAMLETDEGVERAFDKMESIRSGLQTWQRGARAGAHAAGRRSRDVDDLGHHRGGRFQAKTVRISRVNMDGRVIELDLFGIPKRQPEHRRAAKDFIRYASSTNSLANMVGFLPNGPTRKSSLSRLSNDTLQQIPNGPAYEDKLHILSDAQWWAANHARLEEKFDIWMSAGARQGASGTVR